MMKRGREGKTESISTDRFADAVMDVNSEVTSDASDIYVKRFDEEYPKEEKKKLEEAQNAKTNISKKKYNLNNPHENSIFSSELKKFHMQHRINIELSRHILDFIFYQQKNKKNIFKKLLIKMEENLKG